MRFYYRKETMATTKIWAVKDNLKRVIDYATNPEKTFDDDFKELEDVIEYASNDDKTEKQLYVSGINCFPTTAVQEMILSKQSAEKTDSVLAFHAMQSFKGKEVDPATAHNFGVKLANEMWGKEFEVIVTTHLNTDNIHNHFVVNSVSFLTKKRFINRHSDYRRFKELSDRICKEHELSVIETYKSGKSYLEMMAEKNGQLTKRAIIRKDVDKAISLSYTKRQFFNELNKMGYEIKLGKHWALRPKGTEKYFRLYKLSNDERYNEENILQRIYENQYGFVTIQEKPKNLYLKGSLNKQRKIKGFKALCYRYMYLMGVIPKHAPSNKRVHFLFREELIKMDQFTNDVTFIFKNNINDFEELDAYQNKIEEEKKKLLKERLSIYSKIKRCKNAEYKKMYEIDRNTVNEQISLLNEEIKNCNGIRERMNEKIKKMELVKEIENEEMNKKQNIKKKDISK